jgi:hypothetical protein
MVFADHLLGRIAAGAGVGLIDPDKIKMAIQIRQMRIPGPIHDGLEQIALALQRILPPLAFDYIAYAHADCLALCILTSAANYQR